MNMLAYAPMENNYLNSLAETISFAARQKLFFSGRHFSNAPVRGISIAMKTNSAFTGSYTENPF